MISPLKFSVVLTRQALLIARYQTSSHLFIYLSIFEGTEEYQAFIDKLA